MQASNVYKDLGMSALVIAVFITGLLLGDHKGRESERLKIKSEVPVVVEVDPKLVALAKSYAQNIKFRCQSESLVIFTDRGRVAMKENKPENVPDMKEVDEQLEKCAKLADEANERMMEIAKTWHELETASKK